LEDLKVIPVRSLQHYITLHYIKPKLRTSNLEIPCHWK